MTIDPVPADHAIVEAFLVEGSEPARKIISSDPLRRETFDIEVSGEATVNLLVTSQSRKERLYILNISMHNATTCYEEILCRESGFEGCPAYCPDAAVIVTVVC